MITSEQEEYLKTIPAKKTVSIKPFDPKLKAAGESIVSKITKVLPQVKVMFIGAAALEIAGQSDIDVYIISQPKNFKKYYPSLKKLFGTPQSTHDTFVEWIIDRGGEKIEIYLTKLPEKHIQVFQKLKKRPKLLKKYEGLKLKFDGKSYREYQSEKYEFFNKILAKR